MLSNGCNGNCSVFAELVVIGEVGIILEVNKGKARQYKFAFVGIEPSEFNDI